MLFHALDEVLGSTTKVQILRALIPLSARVSGNEARALAGVRSKSAMLAALSALVDLGILERDETRRIQLFRINRDHNLVQPLTAMFAAEGERIALLRAALEEVLDRGGVRGHTLSIILFGSNARGDAKPGSDVDLLVVARGEPTVEAVQGAVLGAWPELRRRFGLRITPYVLDEERVRERYRDGDPLMHNIASEGRPLYGTHFHDIVGEW
jgi:predicted nucleotidyltransferase